MYRSFAPALAVAALSATLLACDGPARTLADAAVVDLSPHDSAVADALIWPPSAPWWSATSCALPACAPTASALPFDTAGDWTITLTTRGSDCNAAIQALDRRLVKGNVHRGGQHPLYIAGSCDYAGAVDGGARHTGTYGGHTLVTCDVTQRLAGVVEVDVATVTFGSPGVAAGQATAYFSNWPAALAQPGDRCQAEFDVTMTRAN